MKIKALLVVAILFSGSASTADAAFRLKLDDLATGGLDVDITDNVAGDGSIATKGMITYFGPVGGFFVTFTTGLSTPFGQNNANSAQLHLNSLTVTPPALGGTLRIQLTDTGFSINPADGIAILVSEVGGVFSGSTINVTQIVDLTDKEFGTGGTAATTIVHPTLPPPSSQTLTKQFAYTGGKFSITEDVTLVFSPGASITSFDLQSTVHNPAPPAIILVGIGIPFLLLRAWICGRGARRLVVG